MTFLRVDVRTVWQLDVSFLCFDICFWRAGIVVLIVWCHVWLSWRVDVVVLRHSDFFDSVLAGVPMGLRRGHRVYNVVGHIHSPSCLRIV